METGLVVAEMTLGVVHAKADLQEWTTRLPVRRRLGLCVCRLDLCHLAAGPSERIRSMLGLLRASLARHLEESRCTPDSGDRLTTLP